MILMVGILSILLKMPMILKFMGLVLSPMYMVLVIENFFYLNLLIKVIILKLEIL